MKAVKRSDRKRSFKHTIMWPFFILKLTGINFQSLVTYFKATLYASNQNSAFDKAQKKNLWHFNAFAVLFAVPSSLNLVNKILIIMRLIFSAFSIKMNNLCHPIRLCIFYYYLIYLPILFDHLIYFIFYCNRIYFLTLTQSRPNSRNQKGVEKISSRDV